jgi:hypothetical protein
LPVVVTVAVPSPGSAPVTKRETSRRAESPLMARPRGSGPVAQAPVCAPVAGSRRSSRAAAPSVTQAALPLGANTRPCGCEARGSATVRATASVEASMTLIEALSRLSTHSVPSGARAMLRGAAPTATTAVRTSVALSMTATLPWSGLMTHRRAAAPLRGSSSMAVELRAALAVAAVCTACTKLVLRVSPAVLRTVSVTV